MPLAMHLRFGTRWRHWWLRQLKKTTLGKGTVGNGTRSSMGVSQSVLSKGPPLCSLLAVLLLPRMEEYLQKHQALFHEGHEWPNWSGAA